MKIELLDYTEDAEYKIGLMAAECYDSNKEREACLRRAKACKDSGHLATLRFAYATFRVSDISRVCSHQLVRHAHLSYLQRSQRYVKEEGIVYCDPASVNTLPQNLEAWWKTLQDSSEELYLRLVNDKIMKKEDARFILPQGCSTSLTVTGNFQAWLDFINLRADKHAQAEIRNVAIEVRRQLNGIAPNVFEIPEPHV